MTFTQAMLAGAQVRAAITPFHPHCLSASEIRALRALAQSLNARDLDSRWQRGSPARSDSYALRPALAAS